MHCGMASEVMKSFSLYFLFLPTKHSFKSPDMGSCKQGKQKCHDSEKVHKLTAFINIVIRDRSDCERVFIKRTHKIGSVLTLEEN